MQSIVEIIFVALLGYFLLLNGVYLGITIAALLGLRRESSRRQYLELDRLSSSPVTLPLSVLVPAYNEEAILRDTVLAILASTYPEFEVIIVSDGSTDATVQVMIGEFDLRPIDVFNPSPLHTAPVRATYCSSRHPNLWLVDKENGGAADALNAGLNRARYPFIAHVDADCLVEPDALMRAMRPINFEPSEVVIVGAHLRVANGLEVRDGTIVGGGMPHRMVERFQFIEYLSSFVVNRLGWGSLNAIPVISGGFGVWPRRLLLDLDGFSTTDTHCDIEATLRAHEWLHSRGIHYRMLNVPDAVVWTQAPTTWRDLFTQRKRWQRVVFEVLWKYRRMLFNPRYGYFGIIAMPYLLLYEGLGPFVETLSYVLITALAVLGLLSINSVLLFLCFSFGLTAFVRVLSLLADVVYFKTYPRRTLLALAALAFLEPLVYHAAQLPHRMAALFEFLRGQKTHEQMTRRAVGPSPIPETGGVAFARRDTS